MSKKIAYIPLEQIRKLAVVFGNGRSLQEVKAHTGADYVCNGGFYNANTPVCHLKVDGTVYASANWMDWGYAWNDGKDLVFCLLPVNTVASYISALALIAPGVSGLSYRSEIGGKRARTAIGVVNGKLILYCCSSGNACSPEQLRAELLSLGCTSALMLDGGGSSQCDFAGSRIVSSRRVNNYICVWHNKASKPIGRYMVKTGGSTLNIRATPSIVGRKLGYYRDGQIISVYEIKGKWARTMDGWCHTNYIFQKKTLEE